MAFCSDHREAARDLLKYGVDLPPAVSGWLLLRRAALTMEQRQLVMSQVSKDLTVAKVEEALYFLFGQDFRGRVAADGGHRPRNQAYRPRPAAVPGRWTRQWKSASSNAYTVEEDDYPDEIYNEQDLEEVVEEVDWEEEDDSIGEDLASSYDGPTGDSAYLLEDEGDEVYEEAFASYLDARRRFAEVIAGLPGQPAGRAPSGLTTEWKREG